jgi:hypothetical protein
MGFDSFEKDMDMKEALGSAIKKHNLESSKSLVSQSEIPNPVSLSFSCIFKYYYFQHHRSVNFPCSLHATLTVVLLD